VNGRVAANKAYAIMRKYDIPVGIGAHRLEPIIFCEREGIRPDYYFKTLHHDRYWSGHPVLAAANCVASQPESLCPMIEYGVTFTKARQAQQTRVLFPEAGRLTMPTEPGLRPGIDWDRIERV
jgi:hypothetical protein